MTPRDTPRRWNPASAEFPLVLQFGTRRVGVNLPVTVASFGTDGRISEARLRELLRHEVQTDEQLEKVLAAAKREWPDLVTGEE